MIRSFVLLFALAILPLARTLGQQADSLLLKADPTFAEFDSLLNSSDSVSLLGLIDSLLKFKPAGSQMSLRLGYNSNVNSASRSLSINTFGLSPGLSYFHKSGAYADASVYWSQEYEPSVYLSILSAGYVGSLNKYWSILGEYSHYFYFYTPNNASTDAASTVEVLTPYTNNLQISNFIDAGRVTFRFDYSFLFGERTAHRLSPVAGLNLSKKKWLGMDRVAFFPSVNLLFGNETVTEYLPYATTRLEWIIRYRRNLPLFYANEKKVWGIMNYAISAPVSIALKNWSFLASYTYNIPRALPGEELGLSNSGYLTLSVTRYLEF